MSSTVSGSSVRVTRLSADVLSARISPDVYVEVIDGDGHDGFPRPSGAKASEDPAPILPAELPVQAAPPSRQFGTHHGAYVPDRTAFDVPSRTRGVTYRVEAVAVPGGTLVTAVPLDPTDQTLASLSHVELIVSIVVVVALLVLALFALDFYATRVFRSDALRAVDDQLASVESAARAHPPDVQNPAALQEWVQSTSGGGARVTVVASDGTVLADSAADPAKMENHANRPEVQAAIASGAGKDVRQSATLGRALVYRAYRFELPSGSPVVIRFALPLAQVNESIAEFRRRLLIASLAMLILGGVASLIYSRGFSARIERLKDFSHRVAAGNFEPLPSDDTEDELTDLARALNETAAHLDRTIRTLTGERNQSSAILRSMIEGVAVIDSKERVVFCNRAFAEILNIDAARCEGRPLVELVRQADLLDLARRALASADSLRGSLIIGTVMPRSFAVTATPVKALEPAANGAVIVLHDIT